MACTTISVDPKCPVYSVGRYVEIVFRRKEKEQAWLSPNRSGLWSVKAREKLGKGSANRSPGHCRKRKIRCVMAADDPGARCQNCIRLKKDCHFYPVDHPPSFGKKIKSGHNLDAPSTDAETSGSQSSPGTATGTIDPLDDAAFPHLDAQSQDEPFFPTGPMITPTEKGKSHPGCNEGGANHPQILPLSADKILLQASNPKHHGNRLPFPVNLPTHKTDSNLKVPGRPQTAITEAPS